MQTAIVIPEPVICNNVNEYLELNLDYLSQYAIDSIRNHYKNDMALIKYTNESVKYDGYGCDGPEIEIRTLNVIIQDHYKFNKNTNTYNVVYRYDTFICEYIISCEDIPPYRIENGMTSYSYTIDKELFSY